MHSKSEPLKQAYDESLGMESPTLDQLKIYFQKLLTWVSSIRFEHLVDLLLIIFVAGIAGMVTDRVLRSRAIGLTASTLCFTWLLYQRFFLGQEWVRPFAGLVLFLSFILGMLFKVREWTGDDWKHYEGKRRRGRR